MTAGDKKRPPVAELKSAGSDSIVASRVATMHYLEGMTNRAISARLGMSRFRVARLLDLALSSGIVKISIASPRDVDVALGERLRARYDLADALVVPADEMHDDGAARAAVAGLAARYLSQIVGDGSRVGIAWGSTLADLVLAAAEYEFARADTVQLLGNLPTVEGSMHAGDVLARLGHVLGGDIHPLHAPLILPTVAAADAIKGDPSVQRTMGMYGQLDVAVVGIGSWVPPSSRLMEVLPSHEVEKMKALHPVADVCANLFDSQGRELKGPHSDRTIGITFDELRAVPLTIALGSGPRKAAAVAAVLRSAIVDVLVVDSQVAVTLLG